MTICKGVTKCGKRFTLKAESIAELLCILECMCNVCEHVEIGAKEE